MSASINSNKDCDFGNKSLLLYIANICEKIVLGSAYIFCWAYPLLILAIVVNVVMRYGFDNGLMVFEEIQWHLYAIGMMFGLSYAEITNSQVRVDVIADKFKRNTKHVMEIIGIILFVIPFIYVVVFNSYDYVESSFRVGESSDAPLGLPFRWAIKAVIPLSFSLLGIAVLARLLRSINALFSSKGI